VTLTLMTPNDNGKPPARGWHGGGPSARTSADHDDDKNGPIPAGRLERGVSW